jgi:hypothetical protein
MTVQDDAREHELCNLFNLEWDPQHARGGTDATLKIQHKDEVLRLEFEVKSSTGSTVSTARDVSMRHIERWRSKHWVIGFYSSTVGIRARLNYALYLTPADIAPWLDQLEAYIRPDFLLAQRAPQKLTLEDLIHICGERTYYTVEDAKRIFKKQWKADEYKAKLNWPASSPRHYSPDRMLEILRLRARYTMERGATLNNPHITKAFLERFAQQRITGNHAQALRDRLSAFLGEQRGEG